MCHVTDDVKSVPKTERLQLGRTGMRVQPSPLKVYIDSNEQFHLHCQLEAKSNSLQKRSSVAEIRYVTNHCVDLTQFGYTAARGQPEKTHTGAINADSKVDSPSSEMYVRSLGNTK